MAGRFNVGCSVFEWSADDALGGLLPTSYILQLIAPLISYALRLVAPLISYIALVCTATPSASVTTARRLGWAVDSRAISDQCRSGIWTRWR